MDISFIVLAWNSEKHLARCLDSLVADLEDARLSYEVLVVNNGSADATASILATYQQRYPDRIRVLSFEKNRGTTYSRNRAIEKSAGRFIGIMDSDVEVKPGTTRHLVAFLREYPGAGLIAPRLVYGDGRLQKSCDAFPTLAGKLARFFFLKAIERREAADCLPSSPRAVDYAISALWILRREAVEKVGLFDERIFYAPEDADYCLRLWKAGYKVVYDPRVNAIHHAQEISRGWRLSKASLWHIKGLLYYFKKHESWFRTPTSATGAHAPGKPRSRTL